MGRSAFVGLALMALTAVAGTTATTPLASSALFQSDVLNLTKRQSNPAAIPPVLSLGGPPSSPHVDPSPLPVVITLASLDKTAYRGGEPLVFEVVVSAEREVTIPWSTSPWTMGTEERDATDGGVEFHIGLEVVGDTDELNRLHTLGTVFGSNRLPGSLRTLRPGEAVRIRVPGYWQYQFLEERGALAPTVRVRAYLSSHSRSREFRQLSSRNSLSVKTSK